MLVLGMRIVVNNPFLERHAAKLSVFSREKTILKGNHSVQSSLFLTFAAPTSLKLTAQRTKHILDRLFTLTTAIRAKDRQARSDSEAPRRHERSNRS